MPELVERALNIIGWEWVYAHLLGGSAPMSALLFSTLISLGVGFWLHRKRYGEVKTGLISFGIFVCVLWMYVLTATLSKWENYDYALAYQGLVPASDVDGRVQVGINFVNVGPTAIKYKVENLRVVIGETTLSNPEYIEGSKIIPQNMVRLYRYPPFSSDSIKAYAGKDTPGTVEFIVNYGPYNGAFKRTLKMKLKVNFYVYPGSFRLADTIAEEQETSYKGD